MSDTSGNPGGNPGNPGANQTGRKRHLGRGLSALLGDEGADYADLDRVRAARTVATELLSPSPFQPRRRFDEGEISGLAESIRQNGILQPILVRRRPDSPDRFEIVAGERRWRAAQEVQLHEVPIIVKELSDQQVLEMALVENLQRQDLSAIEEADGYQRLISEFGYTQEALAGHMGKSRSHVANTLRLLNLPAPVKDMLQSGELSAGHGRALLAVRDPLELARVILRGDLNVRQAEKLAQAASGKGKSAKAHRGAAADDKTGATRAKDADTLALERDLSTLLGLKVSIAFDGTGGTLTIHYATLEQLDDVLHRLHHGAKP